MKKFSLDEMYKMTAYIYSEQNFHRSLEATFLHFVEVCGMLTILARKKRREAITFEDSICKAFGWFFPLMSKCGINSIQEIVFRKYPYTCPYCRRTPHVDADCKVVRGEEGTVDHEALRHKYTENIGKMPKGINEWQKMFADIYPRNADEITKSTVGLMEELGELAEALRVHRLYPKFLAGEVADIFSYLMGLVNEYNLKILSDGCDPIDLEMEYISRYPGLCIACGNRICACPSVPPATIGRMSKELDIVDTEKLFTLDALTRNREGDLFSSQVLKEVGGLEAIAGKLPLDRGQINSSLILVCLKLSVKLAEFEQNEIAEKLNDFALKLSSAKTEAGSHANNHGLAQMINVLSEAFRQIIKMGETETISEQDGPGYQVVRTAGSFKVLIVCASSVDDEKINIDQEVNKIKDAISRKISKDSIDLDLEVGITVDRFRRSLLDKEYDIIHFCGHGSNGVLCFVDDKNESVDVPLDVLRPYIDKYPSIKAVILNCCDSLDGVENPIGPVTIGMEKPVGDEDSIRFSVGFYDALCLGHGFERAVEEGKANVHLAGTVDFPIKVLGLP